MYLYPKTHSNICYVYYEYDYISAFDLKHDVYWADTNDISAKHYSWAQSVDDLWRC